jgi:hypothetical protein
VVLPRRAGHKLSTDTELVEGGQLLAMFIDLDIAAPDRHKHDHDHDDNRDDDDDNDDDKN